jgi:hypothetical protein
LLEKKVLLGDSCVGLNTALGLHLFDVLGTCDRISAQQFIFTLGLLFNAAIGIPIFALIVFGKKRTRCFFF